jgi:hypothetical protein
LRARNSVAQALAAGDLVDVLPETDLPRFAPVYALFAAVPCCRAIRAHSSSARAKGEGRRAKGAARISAAMERRKALIRLRLLD